ncbi:MAG: DUF4328 domain-containing protein [Crocinitomicaceae bacterium]|nr:DUF4328 domain-containing protein [Crocinitomicaceae bacterium]
MEEILDDKSFEKSSLANLRNNEQRKTGVIVLFSIVTVFNIVMVFLLLSQVNLLEDAINGNIPTMEEAEANDGNIVMTTAVSGIARIVLIVLFMMWMRRAYANLIRIGVKTESDDSVAIWSWFVPIYNFIKPVGMILEIWKLTQKKVQEFKSGFQINSSSAIIFIWWIAYVLNVILGVNASMKNRNAIETGDLQGLVDASNISMYGFILATISSIFGIIMVMQIGKAEKELMNCE